VSLISSASGSCLYQFLAGRSTLALAPADTKPLHVWLSDLQNPRRRGRNTNPLFTYFFNPIRSVIDAFGTRDRRPDRAPGRRATSPYIGWLGVVPAVHAAGVGARQLEGRLLTLCGLLFMGLQGLWQDSRRRWR